MLPCCQYTYVKYLNPDGTINEQALIEWATAQVTPDKPRKKLKGKYSEQQN